MLKDRISVYCKLLKAILQKLQEKLLLTKEESQKYLSC